MAEIRRPHSLPLLDQLLELGRQAQVKAMSVALYDYAADLHFAYQAERVFHAASTIKLVILLALFRGAELGRLRLSDNLHVRNRFRSQADGLPFFLEADRDGDPELYKQVGRTASLLGLAETMIVRSSNLATNLLLDHLTPDFVAETLASDGLEALRCVRGVEDEAAFSLGMNNQATANGLLMFLRTVHEAKMLSISSRERMIDILSQQRFNSMIPAGVPEAAKARIAHKTGEISTVCHDAGIIFLPNRLPYILVVLTEYAGSGSASSRHKTVAAISAVIYDFVKSMETPLHAR